MAIDKNEFYALMLDDLFGRDIPKYDRLVIFLKAMLENTIKKWCYKNTGLRRGMTDDDVLQEVTIKIINTCETKFFKPVDGKTTKTCREFERWSFVVARNYFRSYCLKPKSNREINQNPDIQIEDSDYDVIVQDTFEKKENDEAKRAELRGYFDIVTDLNSSPHIVLTWLSLSLVMIKYDATRIASTHLLAEKFSNLTLSEMLEIIIRLTTDFDWLDFDDEQTEKLRSKLKKFDKNTGKTIGDMVYSDFYMKKGPEMSISDWINRVNSRIKKRKN